QHADSDGGEARSAPFGDSGGAFDVAGVRTDAGQAADGGAGGVDDQEGSDVGDPSVLVDQVRLFDDGRGRAHRVEEVREHEGEDRQEGGDDAERREHLAEVELPQRGERRSRRPGVRQGRHPHQVGDDGGDEDAEDQRSLDSAGVEQDRDRQTDERHSRSPRVGEEELDRDRPLGDLGDQTAVDESDEEDEETDADADRPLQRHRDSFHDRLPETHQHQHQDDETFEDDHAHRSGRAQPVAQNEPEGDGAVDAQTGGERDRVVGEDAHGDAQQPGDERGAGGYRPRVEAGGAEDVGVDEDDVGHHQERGDTGAYLGADGRPPLRELGEGIEAGSDRPDARLCVRHRLLRLVTPHPGVHGEHARRTGQGAAACGATRRGVFLRLNLRSMELRNKVIVVTGAARGIGEAMARRFAREDPAGLVISDIDVDALEKVASDIGAFAVAADVSKERDTVALIDAAEDRFGPVDLFCANAGIGIRGDEQTLDEEWQRLWEVNVMSHVYAARRLVPEWRARGEGYFLPTVSAAGLLTNLKAAQYSVTKHAALAFAEWLAVTYGDEGIKVSA